MIRLKAHQKKLDEHLDTLANALMMDIRNQDTFRMYPPQLLIPNRFRNSLVLSINAFVQS